MTHTTDEQYRKALVEVALIVLGRKVAIRTNDLRDDPKALLEEAKRCITEDADVSPTDPEFQLKLRQVARKMDAVQSLQVLANALDEFQWDT